MTKRDVTAELKQTKAKIASLPASQRAPFQAQLATLQRRAGMASVGAVPGTALVAASKARGQTATATKVAPAAKVEWDLAIANELDKLYTAVSDRVTEVRQTALAAAGDAAKPIALFGFGFWPLAIAALAIAYALRSARAGR